MTCSPAPGTTLQTLWLSATPHSKRHRVHRADVPLIYIHETPGPRRWTEHPGRSPYPITPARARASKVATRDNCRMIAKK